MALIDKKTTIQIDLKTIFYGTLVVLATLTAINIIGQLSSTLTLVAMAAFLAVALNPAVSKISSWLPSRSRAIATGTAFILVVSFLIGFFSLTVPPIMRQVNQFASNLPETVEAFKQQDNSIARLVNDYKLDEAISDAATSVADRVKGGEGASGLLSTVNKVTTTIVSVLAVLIMTFMMLVDGPSLMERFWAFQDGRKTDHRKHLASEVYEVITGYVNGQLLITTIAASLALIVMLLLNVPNALAMAGIVAIFGLIPLIGTTLSAVIVVVSTLLVDVTLAAVMAGYFIVYQQIENATIQPYIQGRKSNLSALTVFIAAIIGASLGGLFGAFIAIPVAGSIKVFLDDYLESSGRLKHVNNRLVKEAISGQSSDKKSKA